MHRGFRDVVYNAANVCEPHFVTGKSCDVFPEAIPASQLCRTLKIVVVFKQLSLFIKARFERGVSADRLPTNLRTVILVTI